MRKDAAHFRGSEELLSLVRSSITEASMVNETNEQVIFKLNREHNKFTCHNHKHKNILVIIIGCDDIFS